MVREHCYYYHAHWDACPLYSTPYHTHVYRCSPSPPDIHQITQSRSSSSLRMVPCKAQALANAQSAFMKREETVRSHSRYKQQRDGGDGLPDVTIDVDGMFSLAATSVCCFGQRERSRRRRLYRPSGLVYVTLFVCSSNHLPFHCCQLQDVATHQMFCIVHLPNPILVSPDPLSSHCIVSFQLSSPPSSPPLLSPSPPRQGFHSRPCSRVCSS